MKRFVLDGFGWGFILWFIGYLLGILLFFIMPPDKLGWVIMPIGIVITLWVLENKIKQGSLLYFISISIIWTAIAVLFDYLFIVQMIKPADGYYKFDVYLYYTFTFVLPLVGYARISRKVKEKERSI